MTSIIKVDQIQTASGSTPTATDLGINVSGSLLQVVEYHTTSAFTINGTAIKLFDQSITTKQTNSKIMILLSLGRSSFNQDTDLALALGYKTGSGSSTSTDYTSTHGSSYSRQTITGIGSFFTQDTSDPGGGSWSGGYNISSVNFNKLHSPNVAAGTVLNYGCFGGSDGTFYVGRSRSGGADNGYDTSLTLMEIAG